MEILKKRVGNDLVMRLTISDSGIVLDWSDVTVISAHMYSDGARITAGRCRWSPDPNDHTVLVVTYGPDEPQYLGYNRLVLSCEYRGHTATYDRVVVNYVPLTAMEGTETVADVAVSLSTGEMTEGIAIAVESISSSVIGQLIDDTQEAKEQALAAADRANRISDDLSTFRPEVERALSERVRYADVVDGLDSTETDKPLSANQGRVLDSRKQDKTSLVSDLVTKVNALSPSDKAAFLGQIGAASEESLQSHENDNTRHITAGERVKWNAKQDALTLTIKDNGNIVLGNIQGQSKEFMPATPSGDPMHYAYEAAGAEYNDTGVDIVKTAPWANMVDDEADKTVIHKAGYWYLNGLGNITNEQMRDIYNSTINIGLLTNIENAFRNSSSIRTNFYLPNRISPVSINMNAAFLTSTIEVGKVCSDTVKKCYIGSLRYFATDNTRTKHFIGVLNFQNITTDNYIVSAFTGCTSLKTIKIERLMSSISFPNASMLTAKSILYMIANEAATSAITITLHADAYARAMANADIVAALQAHPNVSLASA